MKKVDVYDLGAKIGKVGYKRSWVNYKFGNGYGQAIEGTTIKTVDPSRGYIFNNQPTLTVRGFVRAFNEKDWERLACFYGGVTAFCLSEDVVIFSEDIKKDASLGTCVLNLTFPSGFEADLKEIWKECRQKGRYFVDFLDKCRTVENMKCNVDSALKVYEIQGLEAIFGILCQLFWTFRGVGNYNCCFIPQVSPISTPKIDNFVSGTTFPVVVSPFTTKFRWVWRNDGCFVECCVDGVWFVFDCISVGQYNLAQESTSARKNFWSNGGDVVPYLVCWCWGDVIDAVGHFNGDVIVRDFRTNFYNHYWFRFGLGAYLTVAWQDARVLGRHSRRKGRNSLKLKGVVKEGRKTIVDINLNGDYLGNSLHDVVYTQEEIDDWLEMADLIKKRRTL